MSRINKDSIDRFYDYDIHVESRTLYMGSVHVDNDGESGTDSSLAERMVKGLHLLDSSASTGDKPITVLMNNPGGDFYHGNAIFDSVKCCKNHITIIVYGHVMSMGAVILQAADKRIMSPNAKMMIHYGYNSYDGHSKTFYKVAEEGKKLDTWMEQLFLEKVKQKHPTFTLHKIKDMLDFDTFLTAKEALDLGLIDEILGAE